MTPHRGLGVTAGLDAGLAEDLAASCSELRYSSLWSNFVPGVPRFETLAHFHAAAPQLDLGIGVLPLDQNSPREIAADLERVGADPSKLWVGIGAGRLRPQLAAVEQAVDELRGLLPSSTRIVVAAMRPRMARLAGAIADGVLLNWMPPTQAAQAREWVREGATAAHRPPPVVASYVRVAVGDLAQQRLRDAESIYRDIDEGHRKHFAALGVSVGSVGIASETGAGVRAGLRQYEDALDLPIVRVVSKPDGEAIRAVAEAGAPISAAG
ncbi:LLM class flavin-dependent oxidoreductase [Mycolicibacterium sp. YH-1]|uniref:LLM class flavin-dependent oxidoreductase n=1 Tax=Mycolicibacterium sp. YH-1 TaxID=2908837 RepID=UPI001F4BD6A6|nr:LLM class flavin-dependent oxidoreductase [Mycolicibacterium sp. YH-1]UNB53134.1 LLM class flavin-dependent oxidoreductase [Mycolicibacterium sp. YH-1]